MAKTQILPRGTLTRSSGAGSLEVYFVREQDNKISQQPVEDASREI